MIEEFFKFAKERYAIKLKRERGYEPPWTEDPILQKYRFCNIFREHDKTTTWFRENIRNTLINNENKLLLATVGFRWFNRIETGEVIKNILLKYGWGNEIEIRKKLKNVKPLVTGAYIIKTPNGLTKLDGILWCMKNFLGLPYDHTNTLQTAHKYLQRSPFMGPFMAYEIITDLRHTPILKNATDIMTWANPGPGCARGAGWVYHKDPNVWNRHNRKHYKEIQKAMREILSISKIHKYWPKKYPNWEMREVEHTLCEFDKYNRAKYDNQRLKRKYKCIL